MTGAEPPDSSTVRLALLVRLAQAFNSSLDLDQVLGRVMDEVIAAVHAERGFVMLHEAGGQLVFRVARGIDQRTIEDPSFQISRGVLAQVAAEGRPVLTSDAQHDDRFSMRQSIVSLGLRSILCVPLVVRDQVTGVIYVDNRLHAGIFTPADLELLTAIASSAAIAIENARLYQAAVETGRLERELQMARELQAGLIPHETPHAPGWEFVARWQPARQVAGDFYDFIPAAGDHIGIVVADVADKGMAAAIFMALTRSTVRASLAGRAIARRRHRPRQPAHLRRRGRWDVRNPLLRPARPAHRPAHVRQRGTRSRHPVCGRQGPLRTPRTDGIDPGRRCGCGLHPARRCNLNPATAYSSTPMA